MSALWMVALACVAQVATSPGQTYLVGLFSDSFQRELGLSASSVSAGYLLGTLASAALQVQVGRRSDRWGPLAVMVISAAALGAVCVSMRWVQGWVSLTLSFFLLRLFGQGALALSSGHTLALHVARRLGRAEGVRLAAIGLAMATVPAWVVHGIDQWGWQATYTVLGCAVWALVLPGALASRLWLHGRNQVACRVRTQTSQSLSEAVHTPAYWLLLATAVAHPTVATALIFHLSTLAAPAEVAVPTLLAVYGIVSTASTLIGGRLADHFPPRMMLMLATGGLALAALTASVPSPVALLVTMSALALGTGLHSATLGPAVARTFGPAHHGALRSSLASAGIAGSSVGPLLLSVPLDHLGSASIGLWVLAGASLAVAVAYHLVGSTLNSAPAAS